MDAQERPGGHAAEDETAETASAEFSTHIASIDLPTLASYAARPAGSDRGEAVEQSDQGEQHVVQAIRCYDPSLPGGGEFSTQELGSGFATLCGVGDGDEAQRREARLAKAREEYQARRVKYGLERYAEGAGQHVELVNLATVTPERVKWLWRGRIPVGKVVTLDGDPALGKSTLAAQFAAVVTTGGKWPDGTSCQYPGGVVLLSAEDGLADTVRPRLDAAGADVSRVLALQGVSTTDKNGTKSLRMLTLDDIAELKYAVMRVEARLLIVDVFMAYLGAGTDSHRDQEVRRVLSRLAAMAEETGVTVLLLRHLNKSSGRDPMYRGGGSIGIIGAARSGMLVEVDPDDPERRILASVKSNLGPAPQSMVYRLVDSPEHGAARIQWEGISEHTAHSLLAKPHGDDDDELTGAEHWLTDRLTGQGPVPSAEVKKEAGQAGFSNSTIQRARKKIGAAVSSSGFPRITVWELPSDTRPEDDPSGAADAGATGTTAAEQDESDGTTGSFTQSRHVHDDGATAPTGERTAVGDEVPDGQADCTPGQTRSTGLQPDLSTATAVPTPLEAMSARHEQSPRRRRTRGAHRVGHPNG